MIVGWTNPLNNRVYPLDAMEMERVLPRFMLWEMYMREEGDDRHSGDKLTVTAGTGCARQLGLTRMLPCRPDPMKMWPAQGGSLLHTAFGLAASCEQDENGYVWYTEEAAPDKCVFQGVYAGVELSCKLDLLSRSIYGEHPGAHRIWDYKTSFKEADRWVDPTLRAKDNHIVQLNVGLSLVEQTLGRRLEDVELSAWVVSATWVQTFAPRQSEQQVMATPMGKTKYSKGYVYSYGELLAAVDRMFTEWRNEAAKRGCALEEVPLEVRQQIVRKMPMYGQHMWEGKKGTDGCDYCAVKKDCDALQGGL